MAFFLLFFNVGAAQCLCWLQICSKVKKQQSNETCCNVSLVKSLQKPSWVSQNNAHSGSEWLSLSSGYLFTLQTLLCADTTRTGRRLRCVSVREEKKKKKKQKRLHILYIGYTVSPPETGERTAITVIASLTGWGALSRQEERKQWVW